MRQQQPADMNQYEQTLRQHQEEIIQWRKKYYEVQAEMDRVLTSEELSLQLQARIEKQVEEINKLDEQLISSVNELEEGRVEIQELKSMVSELHGELDDQEGLKNQIKLLTEQLQQLKSRNKYLEDQFLLFKEREVQLAVKTKENQELQIEVNILREKLNQTEIYKTEIIEKIGKSFQVNKVVIESLQYDPQQDADHLTHIESNYKVQLKRLQLECNQYREQALKGNITIKKQELKITELLLRCEQQYKELQALYNQLEEKDKLLQMNDISKIQKQLKQKNEESLEYKKLFQQSEESVKQLQSVEIQLLQTNLKLVEAQQINIILERQPDEMKQKIELLESENKSLVNQNSLLTQAIEEYKNALYESQENLNAKVDQLIDLKTLLAQKQNNFEEMKEQRLNKKQDFNESKIVNFPFGQSTQNPYQSFYDKIPFDSSRNQTSESSKNLIASVPFGKDSQKIKS